MVRSWKDDYFVCVARRLMPRRQCHVTVFWFCGLWDLTLQNSRVEYVVEFLGRTGLLLEIFYRSSISLRFLRASSCTRPEAFQYSNFNTSSLRTSYVGV